MRICSSLLWDDTATEWIDWLESIAKEAVELSL